MDLVLDGFFVEISLTDNDRAMRGPLKVGEPSLGTVVGAGGVRLISANLCLGAALGLGFEALRLFLISRGLSLTVIGVVFGFVGSFARVASAARAFPPLDGIRSGALHLCLDAFSS